MIAIFCKNVLILLLLLTKSALLYSLSILQLPQIPDLMACKLAGVEKSAIADSN